MYLCNCTKHCKRLKQVSRSTYQRHAQFRNLDFTNTYNASGQHTLHHANSPARDTSTGSNHAAGLGLGRDGTMAEPRHVSLVTLVLSYSTIHSPACQINDIQHDGATSLESGDVTMTEPHEVCLVFY